MTTCPWGTDYSAEAIITRHAADSDERSTTHRNGLPRMDHCRSYRHAVATVAGGPVSGGTGRAYGWRGLTLYTSRS